MAIYVRNQDGEMEPYKIVGLKGQDGVTPNITIGTVTTLEAGQRATVTREGTKENPVFNFGIPKGADGVGGNGAGTSIDDSTISTEKTWSSSKIEDFVHTNDGVIWSTVQGANLSVDYTKEGYLREIEIWGNTVQNEEDLSNIQHLGELHVDDKGQPILDKEGKKQYKIDIEICNINLWDVSQMKIPENWAGVWLKNLNISNFKLITGKTYYFDVGVRVQFKKNGAIKAEIYSSQKQSLTIPEYDEVCFDAYVPDMTLEQYKERLRNGYIIAGNKAISNYVPHESHKTTLLLPCQLMKVGDISDRLYWDSSKGRYVIEKNIIDSSLTGLEDGWLRENALSKDEFTYFKLSDTLLIPNNVATTQKPTNIITSLPLSTYVEQNNNKFLSYFQAWNYHFIGVPNNYLDTIDINGFKKWLFNNNLRIITKSKPQLIETNITKQILLPCYKDKTHLFVTGGIDGSIKAKAPVDGGKAIQSLSARNTALTLENAEIKETNILQDELINTTMLATDEMLSILEPLLIDLLTNEKSYNKIADMYAAMIKRGLKKEEDIPERYRE